MQLAIVLQNKQQMEAAVQFNQQNRLTASMIQPQPKAAFKKVNPTASFHLITGRHIP